MSTSQIQTIVTAELAQQPARPVLHAAGPSRLLHVFFWLSSLAILTIAATLQVQGETQVVLPVWGPLPELCYWRVMFEMDCPGCGLTRCFISAAHGNLAQAWRYNPVGVMLFGTLLAQIAYRPWQLWRIATGRGEFRSVEAPYVMLGVSLLLLVQWFWRLWN